MDTQSDSSSEGAIDKILDDMDARLDPIIQAEGPIEFPYDVVDSAEAGVQADLNASAEDPPDVDHPAIPLKLSYLEDSFNSRNHTTAIGDLMQSKRIVIDDKYTLDESHYYSDLEQMMSLHVQDFFLDFTMYVGRLAGLGAIMPTPDADHSWVFVLNIRNQSRNFHPKHSWIGFDVSGRMIEIGTVRGREHVWVAFAPDDIISGSRELDEPSTRNGAAPHVTTTQCRKFFLFLAKCLADMRFSDIYCNDPYADVTLPSLFERSTNILVRESYDFNVADVKRLDHMMRTQYADWVNGMPGSFSERLFRENTPITISYHYGQDSPLRVASVDDEADIFRREHDLKYVRTLSTALAVHLRHDWSENGFVRMRTSIPERFQKPPYYDHWNTSRHEIPMEEIENGTYRPIDVDNGDLNPLYNSDGWQIHQVSFVDEEALPALFDLTATQRLYRDAEIGYQPTFYRYPLANLHSYGNFQAKGPMANTQRMFNQMNRDIDGRNGVVAGLSPPRVAVVAGGSQGYNLLSHRMRHGSKYHDAQLAWLCAALGGSLRRGVIQNRKFESIMRKLAAGLPHEVFEHKIKDLEGECCDIRLEDVIHMNLDNFHGEKRDAAWIYHNVFLEWMNMWYHGHVLDDIKTACLVFRSKAFPNLFLWTAWPLWAAMERLWAFTSLEREKTWERHLTRFQHLELMSYLSRLWNFNQTGDLRVIPYKAFKALGAYKSFLKTNWLSFRDIASFDTQPSSDRPMLSLSPTRIPVDEKSGELILSADSSLAYHYNDEMAQLYRAYVKVCLQTIRLPSDWKPHWPSAQRQLHRLVHVVLVEFQKSVVDLVVKWVESDVKRAVGLARTPEDILRCGRRTSEAKLWAKMAKPLSYEGRVYETLCKALHEDPLQVSEGLPPSDPKQMSHAEFANLLACMGQPSNPAPLGPPVAKSSSFLYILRSCIAMFWKVTGPVDDHVKTGLFVNHANVLVDELGINYIPWSAGYFPPSGKTSGVSGINRSVVPTKWMSLGGPAPKLVLPRTMLTPAEAAGVALGKARRDSMLGHPGATWSIASLVLRDMNFFLNRRIKPSEWGLEHAGLPSDPNDLITRTYHWVNDHIDLHNPAHHVVLLTAIIFAKALPTIAHPSGMPDNPPVFNTPETNTMEPFERDQILTDYVCKLPWTDGGRGTHQLEPFLVMFVVVFIAWKDERSPLNIHYTQHSNTGPTWLPKHRKKFITPINFVRCRLAVALAPSMGIFTGSKYGRNWTCMSDASLTLRHTILVATFSGQMGDHGIYCVLHDIFGHNHAVRICRSEGVDYPDSYEDRIRPPPLEDIIAGGTIPQIPLHSPLSRPARVIKKGSHAQIDTGSSEGRSDEDDATWTERIRLGKKVKKRRHPLVTQADILAVSKRPKTAVLASPLISADSIVLDTVANQDKPVPTYINKGKAKAADPRRSRQYTQANAVASSSRVTLDHLIPLQDPIKLRGIGHGIGPPTRSQKSYLSPDGTIEWDRVTHRDIDWTTRIGIDGILYSNDYKPEEYLLVGTPYAHMVNWNMF